MTLDWNSPIPQGQTLKVRARWLLRDMQCHELVVKPGCPPPDPEQEGAQPSSLGVHWPTGDLASSKASCSQCQPSAMGPFPDSDVAGW